MVSTEQKPMGEALVVFDNISVSYGSITALRNVSLKVRAGEICSLIGANGAGKSTLLKALVGLEPLRTGCIRYDGEPVAISAAAATGELQGMKSVPTDKLTARGIALVPEGRRVFTDMSVEENLDMGAFLVNDAALIKRRKDKMYKLFPILGDRQRQKAGQLSGGEQQMLAIARALMSGPRVLLLDEPGLGLAPLIIKHIFQIIRNINREEGVTIFLVEQNAKTALEISSHAYVLETGSLVLEGSGLELLENPRVRAAYLGE